MPRYSDKQLAEALKRSKGMVYVAAKSLGCSHNTILKRLMKSERLRAVKEAEEGLILDVAESRLGQRVYEGELGAIKFLLATKGKGRGYVERVEQSGPDGGSIQHEVKARVERYTDIFSRVAERNGAGGVVSRDGS